MLAPSGHSPSNRLCIRSLLHALVYPKDPEAIWFPPASVKVGRSRKPGSTGPAPSPPAIVLPAAVGRGTTRSEAATAAAALPASQVLELSQLPRVSFTRLNSGCRSLGQAANRGRDKPSRACVNSSQLCAISSDVLSCCYERERELEELSSRPCAACWATCLERPDQADTPPFSFALSRKRYTEDLELRNGGDALSRNPAGRWATPAAHPTHHATLKTCEPP